MTTMRKQDRREFLKASAGGVMAGLSVARAASNRDRGGVIPALDPAQVASPVAANQGKKPLRLGLIIGIGSDPYAAMAKVRDLGLPTCQAYIDKTDRELAVLMRKALDKHKIEATSVVVGGPGREAWNFYEGPLTIGLVPRETRKARIAHIKAA